MSLGGFFSSGFTRQPQGLVGYVLTAYAALFVLWSAYAAVFSRLDALVLVTLFLSFMLVLVFSTIAAGSKRPEDDSGRVPVYDWVFVLCSICCGFYFALNADAIATRITLLDPLSFTDITFASLLIILCLEVCRRTVGLLLTGIVVCFMVYNLYGHVLPAPFGHGYIGFEHFLDIMIFTTDGLFGTPLRVAATYVLLFVLFGTFLANAGGGEFFNNLAASVAGARVGGPAKIAVVSSGLYGTISGSPTSDVVTTGSITIPMMKKIGYPATVAGAVEVAASTGGSILPPVMGSAAFIMAEYTGIPYLDIVVASALPALLYYFSVYSQVHFTSVRLGLKGLDKSAVPPLSQTMKNGGLFLVPLAAIVWALFEGYSPTFVALFGAVAVIAISFFRKQTRLSVTRIVQTLAETGRRLAPVVGACTAAGFVIGGITMTGLAAKLSALVFLMTGDAIWLTLVVAAIMTIILGMGMPTVSSYILAAVLIGPLLIKLGLPEMAAHLFLLYYAVLSAITPPVAVAAFAAASIADDNPMKISFKGVQFAVGAFLLPFFFVLDPALLGEGSVIEVTWATLRAVLAFLLISVASAGCFNSPLGAFRRLLTFALVVPLLTPIFAYQSLGFIAGIGILFWFWLSGRA
ncbi:TRAP transporter fused permease subunit, partial [Litorivicinus sp.]|nr:TRAP transporter fused permease subunit [Litorivicinus sp.]